MSRLVSAAGFMATVCLLLLIPVASADDSCPRTLGAEKLFMEPWPQAATWYGSEALAVVLPDDGVWPTTREGALLAVKVFWYAAGFRPFMEREFKGRIERLDEGPNNAVLTRPTNALLGNEVWTVLTGIDFPSSGCWRVSGELRGQTLSFIVETIPLGEYELRY